MVEKSLDEEENASIMHEFNILKVPEYYCLMIEMWSSLLHAFNSPCFTLIYCAFLLKNMDHPNILKVYELFEDQVGYKMLKHLDYK